MTAWVSSSATSSTGAQSTVIPASRRSCAMSRARQRRGFERECGREFGLEAGRGGIGAPSAAAPCAARARLPGRSGRARPRPTASRNDAVSVAQLRAVDDVALEEDQAPGLRVAKKCALLGARARSPGSRRRKRASCLAAPCPSGSVLGDEAIAAARLSAWRTAPRRPPWNSRRRARDRSCRR